MSLFGPFRKWLALKQYQLEVTFSVYMFTPWEKFFFSMSHLDLSPIPPASRLSRDADHPPSAGSIVFLLFSLTFIAACLYLPHHLSFLFERAWYYINGEHIQFAEAAREVVKEMSEAVIHETAAREAVETVVREL
ncbi:hypothetical protein G7046_g2563 [Stylonectria norvegica]|nr:hypothetical protein G7046_g2563 [Stylonectria norvegica]